VSSTGWPLAGCNCQDGSQVGLWGISCIFRASCSTTGSLHAWSGGFGGVGFEGDSISVLYGLEQCSWHRPPLSSGILMSVGDGLWGCTNGDPSHVIWAIGDMKDHGDICTCALRLTEQS